MIQSFSTAIAAIWNWIRSWFVVPTEPVRPLQTVFIEELPETLDTNKVYVLGEREHRWFVAMLCPCGCNAVLQMSLLPDAEPKWALIEHADDHTVTLQPSVWRKVGCRSHFFLRRGTVQWCGRG